MRMMQCDTDHIVAANAVVAAEAAFETLDDLRATWLATRRRSACLSGAPADQGAKGPASGATLTGVTFVYVTLASVRPALTLAAHVDDARECVASFCTRMVTEGRMDRTTDLGDAAVLAAALGTASGPTPALQAIADLLAVVVVVDGGSPTPVDRPVVAGSGIDRVTLPIFVIPRQALAAQATVCLRWDSSAARFTRVHDGAGLPELRSAALLSWLAARRGGIASVDIAAQLRARSHVDLCLALARLGLCTPRRRRAPVEAALLEACRV